MNKERRKAIKEILARLDEQRSALEEVMDGEQEEYDNLPDNIRYSERGDTMLENVESLSDFSCYLDELISDLRTSLKDMI